jgi:hypothetical protein
MMLLGPVSEERDASVFRIKIFYSERGGNIIKRDGNHCQDYTASYSRKPQLNFHKRENLNLTHG